MISYRIGKASIGRALNDSSMSIAADSSVVSSPALIRGRRLRASAASLCDPLT